MGNTDIFAGVDLGGTNIDSALAGREGSILTSESMPALAHEGPDRVLQRIAELVAKLADRAGSKPASWPATFLSLSRELRAESIIHGDKLSWIPLA